MYMYIYISLYVYLRMYIYVYTISVCIHQYIHTYLYVYIIYVKRICIYSVYMYTFFVRWFTCQQNTICLWIIVEPVTFDVLRDLVQPNCYQSMLNIITQVYFVKCPRRGALKLMRLGVIPGWLAGANEEHLYKWQTWVTMRKIWSRNGSLNIRILGQPNIDRNAGE